MLIKACPDNKMHRESMTMEGNVVTATFTATGTHTGEPFGYGERMPPIEQSGKAFNITLIQEFTFEGDKCTSISFYGKTKEEKLMGMPEIYVQLGGAIPTQGEGAGIS